MSKNFFKYSTLICTILTSYEFFKNSKIKKIPALPNVLNNNDHFESLVNANIHALIPKLEKNEKLKNEDYEIINQTCQYICNRYDCSDFRMQTLIRIVYKYKDRLPRLHIDTIKKTLLSAKFFMDQPGKDSLCLWSENHLILFSAAEYLIGQLYEDDIFTNDNLTGRQHKKIAKKRIEIWLQQRYQYGFIEWYSNTYYEEDIAPLSNLIEFCDDKKIVTRCKMVMDLLLFDLATQSFQGSFTSTSGRQYEEGKKSGLNSALHNISSSLFGYTNSNDKKGLDQNFLYMKNYEVPTVIKEVGKDKNNVIIKCSTGLNIKELVKLYPKELSLERTMMQWAMEAFTPKEVISATMKYINKNNMLENEFLNDFKLINLTIFKKTGLLPLISKIIRPVTNGVAIQRANTYTYKTNDYMLSTAQSYHVGDFGDQQHIWSATLAKDLCIFTTHPAAAYSEKGALSLSPNYWVGNGRNPHSVQNLNVNMTIYYINDKKGFMEKDLQKKSHCYFPQKKFSEVEFYKNFVFGKKNNSFIAIISGNKLIVKSDELIQEGEFTCWISELGSANEENFEDFKERIKNNKFLINKSTKEIVYHSKGNKHYLKYKGNFKLNNNVIDLEYNRFNSPYSQTKRNSKKIFISKDNYYIKMDYENCIREVKNNN